LDSILIQELVLCQQWKHDPRGFTQQKFPEVEIDLIIMTLDKSTISLVVLEPVELTEEMIGSEPEYLFRRRWGGYPGLAQIATL
jgi:hypothetical protein